MDQIPIVLGIARPSPKQEAGRSKKGRAGKASGVTPSVEIKLSNEQRQKVFERDNFTCKCCGFHSKKYQEILFLNRDHADFSEGNLATVCIFCHQCFNLDKVNEMRSGMLLWLPEIDQAKLHHIARAIYVARISQGPIAEAARRALDALMLRREEAKKRISTDDPYILATVMGDYLSYPHYQNRSKKLDGLRLFPLDRRIIKEAELEFNQFPQILAYWRSKDGPFGGKTPQQWISVYTNIARAA